MSSPSSRSNSSEVSTAPGRSAPALLLSRFVPEDAPALYGFMSDAAAMQHTYVAPSLEHCAARLGAYEVQRSSLGFAPWVVREADTRRLVGWGGLSIDPDEPGWGLEVSYAFAPSAWGRGYATELVRASLAEAFEVLSAPEVHGFAKPENAASIRVLDKCGFVYLRHEPSLQRSHFVARPRNPA